MFPAVYNFPGPLKVPITKSITNIVANVIHAFLFGLLLDPVLWIRIQSEFVFSNFVDPNTDPDPHW